MLWRRALWRYLRMCADRGGKGGDDWRGQAASDWETASKCGFAFARARSGIFIEFSEFSEFSEFPEFPEFSEFDEFERILDSCHHSFWLISADLI